MLFVVTVSIVTCKLWIFVFFFWNKNDKVYKSEWSVEDGHETLYSCFNEKETKKTPIQDDNLKREIIQTLEPTTIAIAGK